jgi:hypothetical protein
MWVKAGICVRRRELTRSPVMSTKHGVRVSQRDAFGRDTSQKQLINTNLFSNMFLPQRTRRIRSDRRGYTNPDN